MGEKKKRDDRKQRVTEVYPGGKKSLHIPSDYSLIYIRTHMPHMSKNELLYNDSSVETTEDTRDTLSALKEPS